MPDARIDCRWSGIGYGTLHSRHTISCISQQTCNILHYTAHVQHLHDIIYLTPHSRHTSTSYTSQQTYHPIRMRHARVNGANQSNFRIPYAGRRINFSTLCPKLKVVIWIRIRDYLQILQVISSNPSNLVGQVFLGRRNGPQLQSEYEGTPGSFLGSFLHWKK